VVFAFVSAMRCAALVFVTLLSGCALVDGLTGESERDDRTGSAELSDDPSRPGMSIRIFNVSSSVLLEVRVAEIDSPAYGPNLVPEGLFPGESIDVSLACGIYDVLVVDRFSLFCEAFSVDACAIDAELVVDDSFLENCGF